MGFRRWSLACNAPPAKASPGGESVVRNPWITGGSGVRLLWRDPRTLGARGTATPERSSPRASPAARACRPGGVGLALAAPLLAACSGPQSALGPGGPAASYIAGLSWALIGTLGLVYAVVLVLLGAVVVRSRREARSANPTSDERTARIVIGVGGIVIPALVGAALLVATLRGMTALWPMERADELVVEVIGHQWWWEIRYPGPTAETSVATANELHVPVGRRVRIRLASDDVIHSFWVPALQGKMDLIPGRTTVTWVRADRPGIYRGQCAEYCGVQHARMALLVVADPSAEFAAWLAAERRPAAEPIDEAARRGRDVFVHRGCAACHAVRGTAAAFGRGGPDLTHVASRRTLAAGSLDNVPGNLAGWVADPQALKPGNRMPRLPLGAPELHALVAYLGTLR